jgi:hypothetical protein
MSNEPALAGTRENPSRESPASILMRTIEMKKALKLFLAAAALMSAFAVSGGPLFARGGGGNIMNSPGYQRRLQESRQQLPSPGVQPSTHRRKTRHRH